MTTTFLIEENSELGKLMDKHGYQYGRTDSDGCVHLCIHPGGVSDASPVTPAETMNEFKIPRSLDFFHLQKK